MRIWFVSALLDLHLYSLLFVMNSFLKVNDMDAYYHFSSVEFKYF